MRAELSRFPSGQLSKSLFRGWGISWMFVFWKNLFIWNVFLWYKTTRTAQSSPKSFPEAAWRRRWEREGKRSQHKWSFQAGVGRQSGRKWRKGHQKLKSRNFLGGLRRQSGRKWRKGVQKWRSRKSPADPVDPAKVVAASVALTLPSTRAGGQDDVSLNKLPQIMTCYDILWHVVTYYDMLGHIM